MKNYYINIKWLAIVIPILGISIYEIVRHEIFTKIFSDVTSSFILMAAAATFGTLFSHWLFKQIEDIHDKLFWEQERLKSIFTYTSDGIIVVDKNCHILKINPAAERLIGWQAEEVIGKSCDEIIGCSRRKFQCWNNSYPDCNNVECGHRECWAMTCIEKKISIPYVEMCILKRNGNRTQVSASYSYIPGLGEREPHVKIVMRDISERRELEKAIKNYATLEERYRLAREMHDGLAQTLVYLNIKAHNIEKNIKTENMDLVFKDLKEFRAVTQDVANEVRQNIFNLKNSLNTEDIPFKEWLEDYLYHFGSVSNIKAEFICQSEDEKIYIPTEVRIQLIRIVQESLVNIRKHAQASFVKVIFNKNDNFISVSIIDDGIGINKEKIIHSRSQDHFGLAIMEERSKIVGGKLDIRNNYPKGTVVEVKIPLKQYNNQINEA